jgi:hypothetical protein
MCVAPNSYEGNWHLDGPILVKRFTRIYNTQGADANGQYFGHQTEDIEQRISVFGLSSNTLNTSLGKWYRAPRHRSSYPRRIEYPL